MARLQVGDQPVTSSQTSAADVQETVLRLQPLTLEEFELIAPMTSKRRGRR